jgi:hypothetical protein
MFGYLAQSRAVYKIIYAHPPEYDFTESESKEIPPIGLELKHTIWHKISPTILEKFLLFHQYLHFGSDLIDEKKSQIVHDTMVPVKIHFEVKYLSI